MRVVSVKELGDCKYELDVKFDVVERWFGKKNGKMVLKSIGRSYRVGGQNIYTDEEGNKTENGSVYAEAIDKYLRIKNF